MGLTDVLGGAEDPCGRLEHKVAAAGVLDGGLNDGVVQEEVAQQVFGVEVYEAEEVSGQFVPEALEVIAVREGGRLAVVHVDDAFHAGFVVGDDEVVFDDGDERFGASADGDLLNDLLADFGIAAEIGLVATEGEEE